MKSWILQAKYLHEIYLGQIDQLVFTSQIEFTVFTFRACNILVLVSRYLLRYQNSHGNRPGLFSTLNDVACIHSRVMASVNGSKKFSDKLNL